MGWRALTAWARRPCVVLQLLHVTLLDPSQQLKQRRGKQGKPKGKPKQSKPKANPTWNGRPWSRSVVPPAAVATKRKAASSGLLRNVLRIGDTPPSSPPRTRFRATKMPNEGAGRSQGGSTPPPPHDPPLAPAFPRTSSLHRARGLTASLASLRSPEDVTGYVGDATSQMEPQPLQPYAETPSSKAARGGRPSARVGKRVTVDLPGILDGAAGVRWRLRNTTRLTHVSCNKPFTPSLAVVRCNPRRRKLALTVQ